MADAVLIDPEGRTVILADVTWYQHVIKVHRELAGYRDEAECAITDPVAIHRSRNLELHPTGLEYYGETRRRGLYLMVATEQGIVDGEQRARS